MNICLLRTGCVSPLKDDAGKELPTQLLCGKKTIL